MRSSRGLSINHHTSMSQSHPDQDTVVSAIGRLKSTQDKIYEIQKRLDAIHRKKIKEEQQYLQQKRKNQLKEEVRKFAEQQRKIKNDYLMRMTMNINKYHEKSQKQRSKHKKKLSELKDMLHTQNNWTFKTVRKERMQNQKRIRQEKKQELAEKKKKWSELAEQQKKRLIWTQQQKKQYIQQTKIIKSQEVGIIHNHLSERQKKLQDLQKRQIMELSQSRARSKVNPQDIILNKASIASFSTNKKSRTKDPIP